MSHKFIDKHCNAFQAILVHHWRESCKFYRLSPCEMGEFLAFSTSLNLEYPQFLNIVTINLFILLLLFHKAIHLLRFFLQITSPILTHFPVNRVPNLFTHFKHLLCPLKRSILILMDLISPLSTLLLIFIQHRLVLKLNASY